MVYTTILGTGSYVPKTVLTNTELEQMVDTSADWIVTRTGIIERPIARDESTVSMGVKAATRALAMAHVKPDELSAIICATYTADKRMPSSACQIQGQLCKKPIEAFDISAACSGFIYGLNVANMLVRSGDYCRILLVCSDTTTHHVNFKDRNTCCIFGDGAGAVVLGAADEPGVVGVSCGADGARGRAIAFSDGYPQQIIMDGRAVYEFAVRKMPEIAEQMIATCAAFYVGKGRVFSKDDVSLFIPHQANERMTESAAQRLGMTGRTYSNIAYRGNTSGASIPIALDECVRAGKIKKGDHVLFAAVGGGLTWGASMVRW